MSKNKRIILITILSIILVALLTAFVFATINYASGKKAHAEFSDLTSNSVVNFNQLVKNQYINGTVSDSTQIINYKIANANDKLYIRYTNSNSAIINFYSASALVFQISGSSINGIYNCSNDVTRAYVYYNSGSGTFTNFNIYNLSKMFGQGNEPNFEECENLFTAPYYNYIESQAMFYGLNQNDMFNSLDYQFNTGLVSGYPQNITQSEVTYNQSGSLIFTAKHQDNYTPYWLINFKTIIPKGSIITINLDTYTTQTGVGFGFVYADNTEDYITSVPTNQNTSASFSYSFMNNRDLSAIYLVEGGSPFTDGTVLTIEQGSIHVQLVNDYKFSLQGQYDLGYSDAETYYTDGYGRQIIWGEGYDVGYSRGVSEGSLSDGWTFLSTMFSGVGSVFSIEIFPNVTIGTFVMIPLLLGLIFFIVKLSRGGS